MSQTTVHTVSMLIATRCNALSVHQKMVASMETLHHHILQLVSPRLYSTVPLAGGVASTPQPSQTPACFQQPGPFIYTAPNGFVPLSVVDSTTPPHVAAMSVGTLSPSVEMPATFYTHGSTVTFQSFGDPPFMDLSTCILLVILKYWAPTIA